jgi:hypothetical protein
MLALPKKNHMRKEEASKRDILTQILFIFVVLACMVRMLYIFLQNMFFYCCCILLVSFYIRVWVHIPTYVPLPIILTFLVSIFIMHAIVEQTERSYGGFRLLNVRMQTT